MPTVAADTQLTALILEIQARKKRNTPPPKAQWRESFGTLPDDALSREAARLGEAWRRADGLVCDK
jgi:hypothetical protein